MRVLVTGADGQLGGELIRQLEGNGLSYRWDQLDITDRNVVERTIGQTHPDAVINCAAYTNVDRAEEEAALCSETNARAVAYLAEACERIEATLVQISTDYVFGGDLRRRAPYREGDLPAPQSVYGRTKLEGERSASRCTRHIVVRTCGLYGRSPLGNNFVDKMLQLSEKHRLLRVVNDQECTPTYVPHFARAVLFLLEESVYGTYHVVNRNSTTWFEFSAEIFRLAERSVKLEPISTEQYAAPAQRPKYSVLDTTKYRALGGYSMPPWRDALKEYIVSLG